MTFISILNYLLLFCFSMISTFVLIKYLYPWLDKFTTKPIGPQKIHEGNVPRLGGVSIFLTIIMMSLFQNFIGYNDRNEILYVCLTFVPLFLIGFFEDITQLVAPNIRLFAAFVSAILLLLNFELSVTNVGIEGINNILNLKYISFFFTAFCIVFLTQAFNIIDGLNGLCLFTSIIAFTCIGIIAFTLDDFDSLYFPISFIVIVSGVLIFNFPFSKVFIGDSGAYIIGLLVSFSVLTLNKNNAQLSPFVIVQVLIYPSYELIRSFFRRLFKKSSGVFEADNLHLHSVLYKRNLLKFSYSPKITNAISSFQIICFQVINACYLVYFYENKNMIFIGALAFIVFYEISYYFTFSALKKLRKV